VHCLLLFTERSVTPVATQTMGSRPSVTISYRFKDVEPQTLYWELYEATKAHHFRLESHDDARYQLECVWSSPLCNWYDYVTISVQSQPGGAEAVISSRSSNVCPGCCCNCCRCLCGWYTCFSDNNKNQQHCAVLIKTTRRPYQAAVVSKKGCVSVITRTL